MATKHPKSTLMEERQEFLKLYFACDADLRFLFDYMRVSALMECPGVGYGFTNRPDFRLDYETTFCVMIPRLQSKDVRLGLRVLDCPIPSTSTLELIPFTRNNGDNWLRAFVSNRDQLDEAVDLITQVYKHTAA